MLIKTTEFITGAVKPGQYPVLGLPEIAFAGRSNVGKSSLINVLVNRKNLVRTSSTPGRTQQINFFQVNQDLLLVDLPGYGFARVPAHVKREWGPMVETYLANRPELRAVVLILDIRRIPSPGDIQMIRWLHTYAITPVLVVTKCDKVSRAERVRQVAVIATTLEVEQTMLTFFSAQTREGCQDVWRHIEMTIEGEGGAAVTDTPPDDTLRSD